MQSLTRKLALVAWSALLAFAILAFGQLAWGALLVTNLTTTPKLPWAVPVMAVVLWLMWRYLGGSWWPRSTSEARRQCLRANRVSGRVFALSFLAGVLAIISLAGLWIVLFRLVRMAPNVIPDVSQYSLLTAISMVVMASLVSPLTEEFAFRGYCQVILERAFTGSIAIAISSIFFALAHLTHGLFWPKLLVYFLVGVVFGLIAYLTNSILPAIAVHIVGDLTFFILVWPNDASRRLLQEAGPDQWFWIHVAQVMLFAGLAVAAFSRLSRATSQQPPMA